LIDNTISSETDGKDVPIHYLKVVFLRKSGWFCSYYKQALEEDNLIGLDLVIDPKIGTDGSKNTDDVKMNNYSIIYNIDHTFISYVAEKCSRIVAAAMYV
jgi:hypothetical protein